MHMRLAEIPSPVTSRSRLGDKDEIIISKQKTGLHLETRRHEIWCDQFARGGVGLPSAQVISPCPSHYINIEIERDSTLYNIRLL